MITVFYVLFIICLISIIACGSSDSPLAFVFVVLALILLINSGHFAKMKEGNNIHMTKDQYALVIQNDHPHFLVAESHINPDPFYARKSILEGDFSMYLKEYIYEGSTWKNRFVAEIFDKSGNLLYSQEIPFENGQTFIQQNQTSKLKQLIK